MPARPVAGPSRRRLSLPLAALLAGAALPGGAGAIEFDEVDIFFELNATDRDVGVHVSLDADSWHFLQILSPQGRSYLKLFAEGKLGAVGLTELFLEGEEPSLLEVPFRRFLALVPPGLYEFKGETNEGQPLRSTDLLTTELPCPVRIVSPAVDDALPADEAVIRWRPAPGVFDPDTRLCDRSRDVGLVAYQVIVEFANEAADLERDFVIDLPPTATTVTVPEGFLDEGAALDDTEFKVEILAIEDSGNKTISEREFEVED
jgi:hypothetical protein